LIVSVDQLRDKLTEKTPVLRQLCQLWRKLIGKIDQSGEPRDSSPPVRRHATALVLTIAVHALLLLMLLRMAVFPPPPSGPPAGPLSVELLPLPGEDPTPKKTEREEERAAGGAPPQTTVERAKTPAPPPTPPAPPDPESTALPIIPLNSDEMAASDIAKLGSRSAAGAGQALAGRDQGMGPGQGGSRGGGGGGGEVLYDADWQRRPTSAELAFYIPSSAPRVGWGMIACRTIPGNRVDDCRELDQYPAGSGYASAVRQAAWQFRVLPPRVNGRPMIGEWVRIRIDYTERGANTR